MYCDYEPPEFCTVKTITRSKKRHRCCECGREIMPGSEYRRISGKWDGEFNKYAQCERCMEIWDTLAELGLCLGYTALEDDFNEYLSERKAKKKAREIMRGGGWMPYKKNQGGI